MKPDLLKTKFPVPSTMSTGTSTSNNKNYEEIVSSLLSFTTSLRLWHWATTSYAQHKAFEKTEGSLRSNLDAFVENTNFTKFNITSLSTDSYQSRDEVIKRMHQKLKTLADSLNDKLDIQDIVLAMMQDLNKLTYLLKLN
jgi:hypothetical protein